MVTPTKIYDTPSWSEVAWLRKDTAFPVTQQMANKATKAIDSVDNLPWKIVMWAVHAPAVLVSPALDAVWAVWNAALNWYKTVYNYWADAINRIKWNVVENQIEDFQKKNPNTVWQTKAANAKDVVSSARKLKEIADNMNGKTKQKWVKFPSIADRVNAAWAVTDAEVWDATHRFWYWNDPETVFNRYKNKRKWKKQQNQYSWQISL